MCLSVWRNIGKRTVVFVPPAAAPPPTTWTFWALFPLFLLPLPPMVSKKGINQNRAWLVDDNGLSCARNLIQQPKPTTVISGAVALNWIITQNSSETIYEGLDFPTFWWNSFSADKVRIVGVFRCSRRICVKSLRWILSVILQNQLHVSAFWSSGEALFARQTQWGLEQYRSDLDAIQTNGKTKLSRLTISWTLKRGSVVWEFIVLKIGS